MSIERPGAYYLSAYMSPPGKLAILCDRHDQGVALWRQDGARVELARLWQFERISGQKHHFSPIYSVGRAEELLTALLADEGLSLADIQVTWGTQGLPHHRPLKIPAGAEDLPIHSLAHLFSGLLLDSRIFSEAPIVAMALDHGPDFMQESRNPPYWYAGCMSRHGSLAFAPMRSPAPLYTVAEALFGQEPGTLMALVSASSTSIRFDTESAVKQLQLYGGRTNPLIEANMFVREIISEAERQLSHRPLDSNFTREENFQSAVMKVVQRCCELLAVDNVDVLLGLGGIRPDDCYLSTSGGFALNCPTNTLLMDRFGFRGLLTPPCADDSGQPIGLGLLGLYGEGALAGLEFKLESAYYGAGITDVDTALSEFEPWIASVSEFTPQEFVQDITGSLVAWVDGAAEIGPRALGHRSILGDPRSMRVKDLLNEYKARKWWRPVAPVVMAEYAAEWFVQDRHSPYMLEAVDVLPEKRSCIPAVVHLDGSARHQVLTSEADPALYQAISAFHRATGIPILCNTSLNDKGEPIANTAAEALNFCIRKGIKVAYIAARRVELHAREVSAAAAPSGPRQRQVVFFEGQESARDELWSLLRADGYTDAAIAFMVWNPELRWDNGGIDAELVNELTEIAMQGEPEFAAVVNSYLAEWGPAATFDIVGRSPRWPKSSLMKKSA